MRKPKRLFPFILALTLCSSMICLTNCSGEAQEPFRDPSAPVSPAPAAAGSNPAATIPTILDVRLEGNMQIAAADIMKIIKIRKGRPFSETVLEEDKRALIQKTWFIDVKTKVERTPDGYIITFRFIERPLIHYVKVIGNHAHTKKALLEEANIKTGDALDTIAVQQAAERIEQFYRSGGHHQVHVEILSGTQLGDRGVVFLVSEGGKQRVLSVEFEGNAIATSGRLKTLIQTKPGWFFWVNSEFTRKKLDEDVETLINYYRKLGFFYAKVDRVFEETAGVTGLGEPRNWVNVKFMIDEGPRCKIRDIRFTGNRVFDQEALRNVMKSAKAKNGYYNQDMVEADVLKIKELYGNQGYVFAMPIPDPRVDQDTIDLVINIKEGPRCYLNTLNVEIVGHDSNSESYTKWHPILNRSSLRPGDILRTSEINATKRRLMASQLFNVNPTQGQMPEFIFDYPKAALEKERAEAEKAEEELTAEKPVIRGQAPSEPALSAPALYTPPMIRFTDTDTAAAAAKTYPPAASVYSGSVAPTVTPLQNPYLYPQQPAPASVPAAGMTATQFSVPNPPSFLNPSAPAAADAAPVVYPDTVLGNPFNTLHETVRFDPNAPPGTDGHIYGTDAILRVQEAQTGSLMMSVAVSSDSGLMGRFILEEQNFDILKFPRGYRFADWKNAFRGKGQHFRLEAVPGTQVQRYSASWENPYFFDLDYSFGVSGFYYQRYYDEWYENRLGGTFSFGKLWTQDFSTRLSFGAQTVE
ncbi:MAG: BamA/TamA family outer membrane protein, partial [Planctomycetaceae bacterium]|nr:BamA/TamA family outer membrane protein [Planctomycetaceae bacterium]